MRGQIAIAATTDMSDLAENKAVARSFARHETFHPRYGWLKKGYDLAAADPGAFLDPKASVRLGVGKNMVRAIRYWCKASKLVQEMPPPDRPRVFHSYPTEIGRQLLSADGWDPPP